MTEISLNRLQELYPDHHYNIRLNIERGVPPEQIFQNYLKLGRKHIYSDEADIILETFGDEVRPNLIANLRENDGIADVLAYKQFLQSKGMKPTAPPIKSAEDILVEKIVPVKGVLAEPSSPPPAPRATPPLPEMPLEYPEVSGGAPKRDLGVEPISERQSQMIQSAVEMGIDFTKIGIAGATGAAIVSSLPATLPAGTAMLLSSMIGAFLYGSSIPANSVKDFLKNIYDEEKLWILFTGAFAGAGRALKPIVKTIKSRWGRYSFKQGAKELGLDKAAEALAEGDGEGLASTIINEAAERGSKITGGPGFEENKRMILSTVEGAADYIKAGKKVDWVELHSKHMNLSEEMARESERLASGKFWKEGKDLSKEREAGARIEEELVSPEWGGSFKVREAQYYAEQELIRSGRSPEHGDPVDIISADNMLRSRGELERISEEGSLKFGGEPMVKVETKEVPLSEAIRSDNPAIENILSANPPDRVQGFFERLYSPVKRVYQEIFKPYSELKGFPEYANERRLAQDIPRKVNQDVNDKLFGMIGTLRPQGLVPDYLRGPVNKSEYAAASRLFDLKDQLARARDQEILTPLVPPEMQKKLMNIPKASEAYREMEKEVAQSAIPVIEAEIARIEKALSQTSRDFRRTAAGPTEKLTSLEIVNDALDKISRMLRAYGEDLVKRGKLGPEDLKTDYAPHRVLKYIEDYEDIRGIGSLTKRLKRPFRSYTMKAKGTVSPHETDLLSRLYNYLSKLELHNRVDDFIDYTKINYDALPYLSREEKIAEFGQKLIDLDKGLAVPEALRKDWKLIKGGDGKQYWETYANPIPDDFRIRKIKGREWKVLSMKPGRSNYPAITLPEKKMAEIWDQVMLNDDAILPAKEVLDWLRPIRAVGGPREVVLLPKEIANSVLKFKESTFPSEISKLMFQATSLLKRVWIDSAGIPFQVNNFIGDMLNCYRDDPMAFTKIGQALRASYEASPFGPQTFLKHDIERLSPELQTAIKLAQQNSVINSSVSFLSSDVYRNTYDPRFYKYRGLRGTLSRYNPLNWIEGFSEFRESIPRMTYFLKNVERATSNDPKWIKWREKRLAKGLPLLETKTISAKELEGLEPIAAVGKASRELFVDYGKLTPTFARSIRGFLFPFATFYVQNAQNWAKSSVRHPLNALAKVGTPFAMINYWNWKYFPEQERNISKLWRYIPHIWTPFKTKDGRQICIALQTPVDMAIRLIPGLSAILDMAIRYPLTKDKDDLELLVRETWQAAGMPVETINNLLNATLKTLVDVVGNKDYFGNEIYPENIRGTPEAFKKSLDYYAASIISPYMQYQRGEEVRTTFPALEWRPRLEGWPEHPRKIAQGIVKGIEYGPGNISRAFGIRPIETEAAAEGRVKASETIMDQEAFIKANRIHQEALDDLQARFDVLPADEERIFQEYTKSARSQTSSLLQDYQALSSDTTISQTRKERAQRVYKLTSDKLDPLLSGRNKADRLRVVMDILDRQIRSETDGNRRVKLQSKFNEIQKDYSLLRIMSLKSRLSPSAQEGVDSIIRKRTITTPRSPLF